MFPNALHWFSALVLDTPNDSLWATSVIWIIRVATLLVILRNYIAPYILERRLWPHPCSQYQPAIHSWHLHSTGHKLCAIDRIGISYRSASGEGTSRFTVKIEGLKLEIGKIEHVPPKSPSSGRDNRRLIFGRFIAISLSLSYLVDCF
jgi:hypothetical protein